MSETKYTDIDGSDLYRLFLPIQYSDSRANTTYFRVGGNDLNTIFAGRTDKTIDNDTGFRVRNYNGDGSDVDLRYIFAPLPLYYPNGVCGIFTNENGLSGIIFHAYPTTQALTFFYEIPVSFVLVAGGGNGGWYGTTGKGQGGGGGGGICQSTFTTTAFKTLDINIGFGGKESGGTYDLYGTNNNGGSASFDTSFCTGGTGGLNGGNAGTGNKTGGAGGGGNADGYDSGITSILIGNTTYQFSGGGAGGYTNTGLIRNVEAVIYQSGHAGNGVGGKTQFYSGSVGEPSGESAFNYGGGGGGSTSHKSQSAGDKSRCGTSGAGGDGVLIVYWSSSYDR
jgi:hypothetical protein